jgi:hypothetical protein
MGVNIRQQACFSEEYTRVRAACPCVREEQGPVPEHVLQCLWYDQLFSGDPLRSVQGHDLRVYSPGWWNRQEGPDFRGAQIAFNGKLYTGDVEVHLKASDWRAHGHHLDGRYDEVILHVVLDGGDTAAVATSQGRAIPLLALRPYLNDEFRHFATLMQEVEAPRGAGGKGVCRDITARRGAEPLARLLDLAGEWRMLQKARALRERMDHAGADQAVYEAFLYACGFSHFKHHFHAIARNMPYDRARQLARQDPMLLETALLQLGGLMPDQLPEGTTAVPHFARLRALRRDHLSGLKSLPLVWRRNGVRPNNYPERRLAGAARFLALTSGDGLSASLDAIWREHFKPVQRRRAFEALFPTALGFWAKHCTWTGKALERPSAPLGGGRVRSIIGNVIIPSGLALARRNRDRMREEVIFGFFSALAPEPGNHVVRTMLPRVLAENATMKLSFQRQQGLIQVYQDWCEQNPSCRDCGLLRYLKDDRTDIRPG